ncbi:hairy-related 8.2 isoform X1 [Takifugu flavidus]|uniref:Transcription cofactor HES-6 Hairy and enhancer of split 6 n=1 Tax=Takifugu flavidus TaxID=433684 RepID=A0A5C6PBJ5_9TELE|nr:hairy-related 8.2 isoform X1 [Takifugu flavidus]TWW76725.1 Transcription cofactor HES-6 Hairy and enhancer of split 6 [Takifugu flavidus]
MTASSMEHSSGKRSRAKEERKMRKPLIERKRRERINNCLDQLKEAVIGAFQLDQSKLEKADILEMTVRHLQNIQSSKRGEVTSGLEAQQKYSTGYIQCVHEVHNMLLTCEWMDKTLGSRLLNHLLKSLPRSADHCPPQSELQQDFLPHADQGTSVALSGESVTSHLQRKRPPAHVADPSQSPPPHGPQLGLLEMWRPW